VLLALLAGGAAAAYAQTSATSASRSAPALIAGMNRIDMAMSFAQVRAAFPGLQWVEGPNQSENRYELVADPGVSLLELPYSLTLTAGETCRRDSFALWTDHHLKEGRCLEVATALVGELEKEFSTLTAAPESVWGNDSEYTPISFRTMKAGSGSSLTVRKTELLETKLGDIGGYVEWRALGVAPGGLSVTAGGTYHGAASLARQKGDCSAWAEIKNPNVKERRINEGRLPMTLGPRPSK
jgi:hypothetical protein